MRPIRSCAIAILLFLASASAAFAQTTITLHVDATDAARNVIHSRLTVPVKPGPMTLFYPKWIPGEHTPTGTINDVVALKFSAGGRQIAWRRDDVEMFAFHCDVPAGLTTIDVTFDDVSQPETTAYCTRQSYQRRPALRRSSWWLRTVASQTRIELTTTGANATRILSVITRNQTYSMT